MVGESSSPTFFLLRRLSLAKTVSGKVKGEGKGKVHLITCYEGTEWSRGIAILFL